MPSDLDAMWKPGYDGPAPESPSEFVVPDSSRSSRPVDGPTSPHDGDRIRQRVDTHADDADSPRLGAPHWSPRRWLLIGVALLAATEMTATVVVLLRDDSTISRSAYPASDVEVTDAAQTAVTAALPNPIDVVGASGQTFAGADPRRIPEEIVELWRFRFDTRDGTAELPATATAVIEVIDSRFVVVISGPPSTERNARSTLRFVDASNGAVLWAVELDLGPEAFDIVGANGSVLMVETPIAERRVVGFDIATGDELWTISETADEIEAVGSSAGFEVLKGTDFLARRPTVRTDAIALFDPETGTSVGQLPGEIIATDHLGTYYVDTDGAILSVDLSNGIEAGRALTVPEELRGDTVAVVDGNVVVVRGGEILVGAGPGGEFVVAVDSSEQSESPDDPDRVHLPGHIASVEPMVGRTMIVSGSGRITGAELDGEEVRSAWRRDGVVSRTVQTERGTMILVSRDSGATQALVDGRTGETITVLTMTPGVLDSLEFAGNGVLTRRTSGDGIRVAAIDLDGQEMWSLPGSEPVALGEGIVARIEISTEQAIVVGYGPQRSATVPG